LDYLNEYLNCEQILNVLIRINNSCILNYTSYNNTQPISYNNMLSYRLGEKYKKKNYDNIPGFPNRYEILIIFQTLGIINVPLGCAYSHL